MRRTFLTSGLAALLTFSAACDAPSGAVDPLAGDNGGKEDSLFPNGTDKLGYLKIVPADGTALGLTPADNTSYLVDGAGNADPTAPVRLVEGVRRVRIQAPSVTMGIPYGSTEVVIEKTKTTELLLAGLHVNNYVEYQTTLGPQLQWVVIKDHLVSADALVAANTAGRFLQIPPEPFRIDLRGDQVIELFPITPKGGEIVQPDLAVADPRVTFVVSKPDRTLPNAIANQAVLWATPKSLDYLFPNANASHQWAYHQLAGYDYKLTKDGESYTAIANKNTAFHYYLSVGTMMVEVSGTPGSTVEAPLRRLDVNHVDVELETGATMTYKGKWSVARQIPTITTPAYDPIPELKDLPTGTGVDVVPGKYRVTVSYERQELPSPDVKTYEIEIK